MAEFAYYSTTILTSPAQVPSPPVESGLQIAGLTAIAPFVVRLPRNAGADWDSALGFSAADETYLGLLWPGHDLRVTPLRNVGTMPPALAALASDEPGSLRVGYAWLADRYMIAYAALVVASSQHDAIETLKVPGPLDLEDVLGMIKVITSKEVQDHIAYTIRRDLDGALREAEASRGDSEPIVEVVRPVPDALGLELWDLSGSARDDTRVFDGTSEAAKFSWELAALMSYSVSHIGELRRWRDQRPEQVFHELREGYTFLNDHMALVNATCCLEVAHVVADLRAGVRDRVARYGFDSSAIFIWLLALLREQSAREVATEWETRLKSLYLRHGISPQDHAAIVSELVVDAEILGMLRRGPRYIKEGRNRALDERVTALRVIASDLHAAMATLDKTAAFTASLAQVHDQHRQSYAAVLLAAVASVIAAVNIPSFVDIFSHWLQHRQAAQIVVATVLIVSAVGAAIAVIRTVREALN